MRCGLALLLLVASLAAQTPGLPDQAVWFTDPHADPLPPERDLPGRLADALGAAKESVEASFMRLDAPRVLDALIAAHRRGVVVRVMSDDDMRAHRFAAPFQRLAAAGVSVRTDGGAPWSVNLHHKFCVIDGEWLWNGDWNATVLESRTAHMSAFLLRSRSLAGSFRRQFERLWRGEDAGLGSPASTPGSPAALAVGGTARAHFGVAQDLGVVVAAEILRARRTVDVAHAVFAHRRVLMAVLDVARRGVRVRVVANATPGPARVADACARFGIPVLRSTATKTIVVDGARVITGSWNCTDGVDHENVVVLEGCPEVVGAYERGVHRIMSKGEGRYFLDDGDEALDPSDRQRHRVLSDLVHARGSAIAGPSAAEAMDRFAPPVLNHGAEDLAVVPVRVGWRGADAMEGHADLSVTFQRTGAPPPAADLRFVVSAVRYNTSAGPWLSPRIAPVIFDRPRIGNMDVPMTLPFRMELPRAGTWRVELDAFRRAGDGWVWAGNWVLPPRVRHVAPQVSVDDPSRSTVVARLPVADGPWRGGGAARREGDAFLSGGVGSSLLAAGLDISTEGAHQVELRVASSGEPTVRLDWSRDGRAWMPEDGVDVPLLLDGRPHTYRLDLTAVSGWRAARRVTALRIGMGREGRGVAFHGLQVVTAADLGEAGRGTFRGPDGAAHPRLLVSGAAGPVDRRVWVDRHGQLQITVESPDPTGATAPFLLLVHRGMPGPEDAFDLAEFGISGSLCFRPHLVTPPGLHVRGVADSTGLDPEAFVRPGPAPVTFSVPLPAARVGDTLVLQAVFKGALPGVSNAVVVRVR